MTAMLTKYALNTEPLNSSSDTLTRYSLSFPGARYQLQTQSISLIGKASQALEPIHLSLPGASKQYQTISISLVGQSGRQTSISLRIGGVFRMQRSFALSLPGQCKMAMRHSISFPGVSAQNQPSHTRVYRQMYRVEDSSLDVLELYADYDQMPDFEGVGQPVASGTSITWAPTLPSAGNTTVLYLVVRKRNAFGLLSHNQTPVLVEIDENGDEVLGPLTPPELAKVLDGAEEGGLQAWGRYAYELDRNPADTWELYAEDGVDPDPDVDTPIYTEAMGVTGGLNTVWRGYATGLTPGSTYHVMVVVRRSDDDAYAASAVTEITLGELYDLTAEDGNVFGGGEYEVKQ